MNSLEYNSIIDTINKHELLKIENIRLTNEIEKNAERIKDLENSNKILQEHNEQYRIYSEKLYDDIIKLTSEIENKDKNLSKQSETINELGNDNKLLQDEKEYTRVFSEKLYDDIIKLTSEIENKDKKLSELLHYIKTIQNNIENKEIMIKTLQNCIQNKEDMLNRLENTIEIKEGYIKELEIVINCYQKFSNRNMSTDFSNSTTNIFDFSSSVVDNKYETIIVNNRMKEKTDKFLWTDIANSGYTPVFDLYKSFDDVIKHFNNNCIPSGNKYRGRRWDTNQLNDMQKIKDDEYFIGVYYGGIRVSNYLMTSTNSFCCNLIFYTNYGNIIQFNFKKVEGWEGGFVFIENIEYYYTNRKLDVTFINHLNLIIAKRENTQSFIDITGKELNNIILSLYGVISHSIINSIPVTKNNDKIGWRERENLKESPSLVPRAQSRRKSVRE